jgi:hypothetical protein
MALTMPVDSRDTIPCPPPAPSTIPAPTERCPAWYALEDARSEYDAAKAHQGLCPSCGRYGSFQGAQDGLVHWRCDDTACGMRNYSYECATLVSEVPDPISKTG